MPPSSTVNADKWRILYQEQVGICVALRRLNLVEARSFAADAARSFSFDIPWVKPMAKISDRNRGRNTPNQPRLRGFPEGQLATSVYGVVGVDQFDLGRFNVLFYGGLSRLL